MKRVDTRCVNVYVAISLGYSDSIVQADDVHAKMVNEFNGTPTVRLIAWRCDAIYMLRYVKTLDLYCWYRVKV